MKVNESQTVASAVATAAIPMPTRIYTNPKIRKWVGFGLIVISSIATVGLWLKSNHEKNRQYQETQVKLQQQEEFEDVVNGLLNDQKFGYAVIAEDGRIVEWNYASEQLTGWTFDEIVRDKLKLQDIIPMGMRDDHEEGFHRAFTPEREGKKTIVECKLEPHGEMKDPLILSVTVRVVKTRHGTRYAIAHIDRKSGTTIRTFKPKEKT